MGSSSEAKAEGNASVVGGGANVRRASIDALNTIFEIDSAGVVHSECCAHYYCGTSCFDENDASVCTESDGEPCDCGLWEVTRLQFLAKTLADYVLGVESGNERAAGKRVT